MADVNDVYDADRRAVVQTTWRRLPWESGLSEVALPHVPSVRDAYRGGRASCAATFSTARVPPSFHSNQTISVGEESPQLVTVQACC